MPTLDELMPRLRELFRDGARFDFIAAAHSVLACVSVAPELTRLTLRALAEAGLGGPALELLQVRRDLGVSAAELAALRASCAALPDGRVPWTACEETFQKNFTALAGARPEWREREGQLRALVSGLNLHRTLQGAYYVSRRAPGRLREWVADLTMPEVAAETCAPPDGKVGAAAIVGARAARLVARVCEYTHRVVLWHSAPVYLVEPDPACFAAWLHAEDSSASLTAERLLIFVGPDAIARCAAYWRTHPRLALPAHLINLCAGPQPAAELRAAAEQTAGHNRTERRRVTDALAARYAGRDAAYWLERFKPPGPVLAVTSRFTTMLQYSTRDALAALRALGYTTHVLIEDCDHELLRAHDLYRAVLELDPLFVLALDHARCEAPDLPLSMPFVLWIQDALTDLMTRQAGASVGPHDLVCGYYWQRCTREFGYPPDRFLPVRIPVSPDVFHDGPLDPETAARYAADVCYVGHGGEPIEALYRQARQRWNPVLHKALDQVYGRVQRWLSGAEPIDPQATTEDIVRTLAAIGNVSLTDFANRLYDVGRRQQTLEWVAAWAQRTGRVFRIYGRGWAQHPTLAPFAAGVIEHGEPLRRVYRASKLALQLMPSGFLHQRALEALASGTLPLARYCPEDFAQLPIETFVTQRAAGKHAEKTAAIFAGLERVVFRTPAEFEIIAERYLADADARQSVWADLHAVVQRDYTYESVMRRILEAHRAVIQRRAEANRASAGADAPPRRSPAVVTQG
ncbi:MAG: glycosyltransferase family 1 protein [Phycisphaerae bacterium]|nr:glycosyltransferase family 1 protein [Phycisphaerae bacterium]